MISMYTSVWSKPHIRKTLLRKGHKTYSPGENSREALQGACLVLHDHTCAFELVMHGPAAGPDTQPVVWWSSIVINVAI